MLCSVQLSFFFFYSRRRPTCCSFVAGVPTCALPILAPADGALLPAICSSLQQMLGVRLSPDDFALDKLDSHLLPRLQLENDKGAILGVANTLDGLRGRFSGAARTALNQEIGRAHV